MSCTHRRNPCLLILAALIWIGAATAGGAATFNVTSTGDTGDTNTADNACVASGGGCTLRAAIQQANATAGTDTITFSVGSGTISPASPLPAITEAVTINGGSNPTVTLDGTSAGAGANGLVLSANGCVIQGLVVRNFSNDGIVVNSSNNTIARNNLGTDAAGTTDRGNTVYGLAVTGNSNTIGGAAASYADRNTISGNDGGGLFISGGSNVVQNNFIGVTRAGSAKLANTGSGVILSSATGNTLSGNIISGNTADGVHITGGSGNVINSNSLIGLNNGATANLGNSGSGVYIDASTSNTVGSTNLISGNGGSGVYINGATATGNTVTGNFIGLAYNPPPNLVPMGNTGPGVTIAAGASNNTIGGLSTGTGNVISANSVGVLITGGGSGNKVVSNVIGAAQGSGGALFAVPNLGDGVQIVSSPNNTVGIDSSTGSGNNISGNMGNGVYASSSNGTVVAGDTIGASADGTAALPNHLRGVALIGCSNATVGGSTSGKDNEIAGNLQDGVYINGGSNNQILNNEIGIDGNGVAAVGNGGNGIYLQDAVGTLITTVLVSSNTGHGVRIVGGSGTSFRANFVGTNLATTQAFPNGGHGLSLENTTGNNIGQPFSGGGNIISGNAGSGVALTGSSNNVITNNSIGLNLNNTVAVPNSGYGILLQGSSNDNTIGGSALNFISSNGSGGIGILSGLRNQIRPNAIYANGGLGIDLDKDGALPFDGVTFNDPADADTGANGLLNAPTLTSATTSTVNGRIRTTPSTSITVDLYKTASCDPAGFGEGATYLGAQAVTTSASGVATFSFGVPTSSSTDAFAATATDPSLNTSEFSQCISPGVKPPETLVLFNASTRTVGLISTLTDPLTSAPGAVTSYAPGATGPGQWVMGDWNGDGIDTPAVYYDTGVFAYTNDVGPTSNWTSLWFGLLGHPPVAGRFNPGSPNDCLGVVDSKTAPNGVDTQFSLYYTCDLTSGPNPPKQAQWLSLVLPNSQGFTGTHQFMAGDFDKDGIDSIAVRRGPYVAFTNVAPSAGPALFNLAQYFGVPPGANGEGNFVVGDWDGDGASSFGILYADGTFQRRNDLAWNTATWVLQRVGQPIGTTGVTAGTWRPGGK